MPQPTTFEALFAAAEIDPATVKGRTFLAFHAAFGEPLLEESRKVKGMAWRISDGLEVYLRKDEPRRGGHALAYAPRLPGGDPIPVFAEVVRATGEKKWRSAGTFNLPSMGVWVDVAKMTIRSAEQIDEAVAYLRRAAGLPTRGAAAVAATGTGNNTPAGDPPDASTTGSGGARGRLEDAAARKAIELRAMDLAEAHYASKYRVERRGKPYDLHCTAGAEEVHVEVKGTSTAGETVVLTPNEVHHARTAPCRVDFFHVVNIRLEHGPDGNPTAAGGEVGCHIEGWRPADEYEYRIPRQPPAAPQAGTPVSSPELEETFRRLLEKLNIKLETPADKARKHVTSYFASDRWHVERVDRDEVGYDLCCRKAGTERHVIVEVTEGATAAPPSQQQIEQARRNPKLQLYAVTKITSPSPEIARVELQHR